MSDRVLRAPWLEDPAGRAVFAALEREGGPDCARYVGGCVRNTLMGSHVDVAGAVGAPFPLQRSEHGAAGGVLQPLRAEDAVAHLRRSQQATAQAWLGWRSFASASTGSVQTSS